MTRILSIESDAKTVKGSSHGYLTGAIFMAPHTSSGLGKSVCPFSTGGPSGCRKLCIAETGMGVMPTVRQARITRARWFLTDRTGFIDALDGEIERLCRQAERRNLTPAVRLNATSDIRWERVAKRLFADYPEVIFYDYSKHPTRRWDGLPSNYHLTASWSNRDTAARLESKLSVAGLAVPFAGELPSEFLGRPVVDGDAHDLRFIDAQPGAVIGLRFKGRGGSRPQSAVNRFAVQGAAR